ncbi:DNA repair protein XRCC1 [Ambystoma mexicanum]|uniref:DNA repair protein XRCC1 n=1 Tax=Ambystoma mexicanum TaxID=8296 RepID=UPI0037E924E0
MPEIKVKHVVSCSSEDTTHKAENLLKADTYRKWKANKSGEKQVSVILQLEKEEQIHSLDIGNEGSAFVEVLVGHATSASEQDYEVILVTSSFMSPSESKNGSNLNRVRMFGPDKLVKGTAEKKWDRVKIVCTQPYNKNLTYGLCFIRFHSPPDPDDAQPATPSMKVTKLGQFKVKEEETSSLQPGALFFNRASKPSTTPPKATPSDQPSPTYAAAALHSDASGEPSCSPATKTTPSASSSKELTPGKRKFEFKENQVSTSLKKPEAKEAPRSKTSAAPPVSKKIKAESPTYHSTPTANQSKKATGPEKTYVKKEKIPTDFCQLLQGTVFVLSGFQNPFRSDLRDKALEMGAKYRPDWTVDCTHLICAFANTPKYAQVKAMGGIIVRKDWILDCYKKKQRLPCKGYLMNGGESSSSDDDSDDDVQVVSKAPPPRQMIDSPNTNHKVGAPSPVQTKPQQPSRDKPHSSTSMAKSVRVEEEDYAGSTDDEREEDQDDGAEDSGGDTEDELRRITEQKRVKLESSTKNVEEDPYTVSTDENTDIDDDVDLPIPELPDFFTGKHFFLYGDFPSTERRMLYRYITAFNGELEDYMNEKVRFVITAQEWDDTFEEALNENCNLSFVKPRWIYTCNERQKLIPHQLYVVVPQV